jgi:transmembrane sensor
MFRSNQNQQGYKTSVKSIRHSPELLREQAIDWLLCLRSETCTQSERRAFDDWLAQSPHHRQAYEEVQAQWEWMEPFKTMPFTARDKALRYRRKSHQPLFAYNAAAALLLALGLTAFSQNGWLGVSEIYIAEKGGRQTITLADDSGLELNTESEARVHFNHWERRV